MSGTVSTRWYFPDWMSDPGVRASSFAARGLWMDMLSIAGANSGREHGYLLVAGKKPTDEQLAKLFGGTVAEVRALTSELEVNRVFNRDRRGVIYSRRMVRAEKSRSNGRQGGNPNLLKNSEDQKQVQPKPNPHIPEPVPEPKRVPDGTLSAGGNLFTSDWPVDYRDRFWRTYPRRIAKPPAMKALDRIKATGLVAWGEFMAGVERYAKYAEARGEPQFIKHPATWLNAEGWADEYAPGEGRPRGKGGGFARVARRLMEQGADR